MRSQLELIRVRGRLVEEDEKGNWNLNDIWEVAASPKAKSPRKWIEKKGALVEELRKKVTLTNLRSNAPNGPVVYSKDSPQGEVIFAHPILAAAYAGHLSPKLEIETRDIWLRFRAGDPTLADEILQRAPSEANEWAAMRALGRVKRTEFTKTLKEHGVTRFGYAGCTEVVYKEILNGTAKSLKTERGLAHSENLRDAMSTDELVSVMFAETLARQRIERESPFGNAPCISATRRSAATVKRALETEIADQPHTG